MRLTILGLALIAGGCAMGDGSIVNVANTTIDADNGSTVEGTTSAPNLDPTTNLTAMPWPF